MVTKRYLDSVPEKLKDFALSDVTDEHIIFNSKLPFIKFDLSLDKELIDAMLEELKTVRESFFSQPGVTEQWARGTLIKHFYYRNKFENYKSPPDLTKPLVWSEDTPPTIKKFFCEMLGDIVYSRIQCDLLLPGGYIAPHADTDPLHNGIPGQLVSLNLAITHPKGCYFYIKNYGHIPFRKPGDIFLIDTCVPHCVVNNSDEDRYHFKIHIDYSKSVFKDKDILNRSYFKTIGTVSNLSLLQ